MFERQRSGSVLCPSCGRLVGVNEKECPYCGRRSPGMFGFNAWLRRLGRDMGFVDAVIGGCVLLYLLMLAADPQHIQMSGLLSLLSPSMLSEVRFGASGRIPVFVLHRWWTLLSAGWLHAGLLHIGFNLYWVRYLAPAVAEFYGPSRMVIIYSVSSVTGFLLSSSLGLFHLGAGLTLGASAPILGFVGALVYYGRRSGSSAVGKMAWSYAITMILFGFLMPGVDNFAHIGGFAGGYLAGRLLDPLKPERGDHQAAALICLGLTAASVVASLVVPLPPELVQALQPR
ncbi:MAG TPA: rhomboid family intramembrane serine protease [Thermoanaerobaculia bacterium]|nr:rhomboid family intramembrane serine protease [Thermoanaerobaculia bacterium]